MKLDKYNSYCICGGLVSYDGKYSYSGKYCSCTTPNIKLDPNVISYQEIVIPGNTVVTEVSPSDEKIKELELKIEEMTKSLEVLRNIISAACKESVEEEKTSPKVNSEFKKEY